MLKVGAEEDVLDQDVYNLSIARLSRRKSDQGL